MAFSLKQKDDDFERNTRMHKKTQKELLIMEQNQFSHDIFILQTVHTLFVHNCHLQNMWWEHVHVSVLIVEVILQREAKQFAWTE